jgi:hypothetical protein
MGSRVGSGETKASWFPLGCFLRPRLSRAVFVETGNATAGYWALCQNMTWSKENRQDRHSSSSVATLQMISLSTGSCLAVARAARRICEKKNGHSADMAQMLSHALTQKRRYPCDNKGLMVCPTGFEPVTY